MLYKIAMLLFEHSFHYRHFKLTHYAKLYCGLLWLFHSRSPCPYHHSPYFNHFLRKRLFDTPDARKVHKKPVSRLGGVSFFPAILFTVTFLIGICYMTGWVSLVDTGQHWVQILFMCTGLTLLYIVGIADDLIGVRYRQKFIVQLIAAFMFPLAGLYINDFTGCSVSMPFPLSSVFLLPWCW